ncbi:Uncharacterized protein family UPF0004, putative, partial [Hepatocystis sp. ex Piliocolobus tephrosceles]
MNYNKLKILSFFCLAATGTYYVLIYKKELKNWFIPFFLKGKKKKKKKNFNSIENVKSKEELHNKRSHFVNKNKKENRQSNDGTISSSKDSYITNIKGDNNNNNNNNNNNKSQCSSFKNVKLNSENINNLNDIDNTELSTNCSSSTQIEGCKEKILSDKESSTLTDVEDISNINERMNYNLVQIKTKKKGKNDGVTFTTTLNKNNKSYHLNKTKNDIEKTIYKKIVKKETADSDVDYNYDKYQKNLNEIIVILPERYKIYFKSFGCAHNSSDSEFMMGLLNNYGFTFVKNIEECDICIINSCTVKNPSEESMKSIINYVKKLNKMKTNDNVNTYASKKGNQKNVGKIVEKNV